MNHLQRSKMKIWQCIPHWRSNLGRGRPFYLESHPLLPSDNKKIQFSSSMGGPEETFINPGLTLKILLCQPIFQGVYSRGSPSSNLRETGSIRWGKSRCDKIVIGRCDEIVVKSTQEDQNRPNRLKQTGMAFFNIFIGVRETRRSIRGLEKLPLSFPQAGGRGFEPRCPLQKMIRESDSVLLGI